MRKWAVWEGILFALVVGAWQLPTLLRWGAEAVLSYVVGTQVTVGGVEAFSWEGRTWRVRLRSVQLASTFPGDSARAATIACVTLQGRGTSIDTIRLQGVGLHFVRIGKAQKNFRFFPRRSARPRPQRFWIEADSLSLQLDNVGAQLALSIVSERASAWVEVDSLSVSLRGLQAQLGIEEVCFRGKELPLPARLRLTLEGSYEKATDNWRGLSLTLRSEAARLHFSGDIFAWERPKGWLHIEGNASAFSPVAPALFAALGPNRVALSAWIDLPKYAAFLWGRWQGGAHAFCAEGEALLPSWVEGRLAWAGRGALRFRGHPNRLQVEGDWKYKGLTGRGWGLLNLSDRKGALLVTSRRPDSLWIEGGLEAASGWAKIGPLRAHIAWDHTLGLQITLDSAKRTEILAALEPYRPLLLGRGSLSMPVRLRCAYLVWDSNCALHHLDAQVGRQISGTAQVEVTALGGPLWAAFSAEPTFQKGWGHLLGESGWASLQWEGDSGSVSAWGHWQGVVASLSGEGSLSARQLRLRRLCIEIPGQGQAQAQGTLSADSADVEVSAQLALPWLWQRLPIQGVELYSGTLAVNLCAQGTWDTLLRWDNPSQGRVSLNKVTGAFVNLGVALADFSAQLHYDAQDTWLDTLAVRLGEAQLRAHGHLQGTLSYLYTDWRQLRGELWVEGEQIALDPFWRQIKRDDPQTVRRRVRLPGQMEAAVRIHLREVDVYGLHFSEVYGRAQLREGTIWADTIALSYAGGLLAGRGFLDGSDTSCYMLGSKAAVQGVSLAQVLADFPEYIPPSVQRAGIQGIFSGEAQVGLRFTQDVQWQEQSTIWATGYISRGVLRTPRFLRWLRPYYLAAYRDSMDFLADVPKLFLSEGELWVEDALLLTRVAAFRVHGFHDLDGDRFLYRFQGTRLYRRAQRYSDLERLPLYVQDVLDRSVLLVYLERFEGRTRWRYPWRYLLRRLMTSRLVEPALRSNRPPRTP